MGSWLIIGSSKTMCLDVRIESVKRSPEKWGRILEGSWPHGGEPGQGYSVWRMLETYRCDRLQRTLKVRRRTLVHPVFDGEPVMLFEDGADVLQSEGS